jgi:hypothetical protein
MLRRESDVPVPKLTAVTDRASRIAGLEAARTTTSRSDRRHLATLAKFEDLLSTVRGDAQHRVCDSVAPFGALADKLPE